MKIRNITETTAGATSSGSVASVAKPLGKMQERTQVSGLQPAEKIMKGKAKKKGPYGNSLVEGKVKELYYDLQHMDNGNFKKKYGKTKEEMRAGLKEEKIAEADLIIVPGMRKSKDTSFIPHKADRRDHEVEMARSDLLAAAKNAMRMYKLLKDRTEDQGLMGWQQSYITLATDYLQSVADNLEYDARTDEMTGGVLAGGMSNFEEGAVNELSPKTKKSYAAAAKQDKEFNQRSIDQALDRAAKDQHPGRAEWEDEAKFLQSVNAKRDRGLKRAGVAEGSLNEFAPNGFNSGKGPKAKAKTQMIKAYGPGIITFRKTSNGGYFVQHEDDFGDTNSHQYDPQTGKVDFSGVTRSTYYGEGVAEGKAHKCPKCGGEMVSEELMNEKKDACYYKVKSRYKVWPSAYASGALVKCRNKGSKNWGKSKK